MPTYFFDSSAVVKRYVSEVGSGWVRGVCSPGAGHEIYVLRVTSVEVVSGLVRHVPPLPPAGLSIVLADFRLDFEKQYVRLEVTDSLVDHAGTLVEKYLLRGYDAMQLAAASQLHVAREVLGLAPLTFTSADSALNTAAVAEGLLVENPNLHP